MSTRGEERCFHVCLRPTDWRHVHTELLETFTHYYITTLHNLHLHSGLRRTVKTTTRFTGERQLMSNKIPARWRWKERRIFSRCSAQRLSTRRYSYTFHSYLRYSSFKLFKFN